MLQPTLGYTWSTVMNCTTRIGNETIFSPLKSLISVELDMYIRSKFQPRTHNNHSWLYLYKIHNFDVNE